jgi:hypothetical protein
MYIMVVSERIISTTFFVASLLLYHHLLSSKIMQLSLLWYLIMGVSMLQWRFWAKQVMLQWRFWANQGVLQWSFWAKQGLKVPSGGAVYYFEDWRIVEGLWLRLKVYFFLHWIYLLYVVILHFICVPTVWVLNVCAHSAIRTYHVLSVVPFHQSTNKITIFRKIQNTNGPIMYMYKKHW